MIYEDPTPIPQSDVRIGYEVTAEFLEDLPEAIRFYHDQRRLGLRVIVVVNRAGQYSVWKKQRRCWPFPNLA
jgi:hypothetical protein